MPDDLVRLSKRIAKVLRHQPERAGLRLDPAGWVPVAVLIAALNISRDRLDEVVAGNDKRRYAIEPGPDGQDRIRASQGHTVPVELGLAPVPPPATLYHGTTAGAVESIMREGLVRGARHDVHLSADTATAHRVGARRGAAQVVILIVDAAAMVERGHEFRCSANGVWLTPAVPARFLRRLPT